MKGEFMENNNPKKTRFLKVAASRTNKILDAIHGLGNCSNRKNYDFSDEEVKEIFDAIEDEVKKTKSLFLPKHDKKLNFSFKNKGDNNRD